MDTVRWRCVFFGVALGFFVTLLVVEVVVAVFLEARLGKCLSGMCFAFMLAGCAMVVSKGEVEVSTWCEVP